MELEVGLGSSEDVTPSGDSSGALEFPLLFEGMGVSFVCEEHGYVELLAIFSLLCEVFINSLNPLDGVCKLQ